VDIGQDFEGDIRNRYLTVKTSEETKTEAKPPWNRIDLSGKIHTSFLFYTALAKNILPFGMIRPPRVLLPIKIGSDKRVLLQSWKSIKEDGMNK
jgi:hypothetical protein